MRSPYGETWAPKTAQQATAATERTTAKRARRPLRTGIAANRSMRKPFLVGRAGKVLETGGCARRLVDSTYEAPTPAAQGGNPPVAFPV
jgi:hypothetical protein